MDFNFNTIIEWIMTNLPFLIACVFFLLFLIRAVKRGFAEEFCAFVSAVIASIAILLLAFAIKEVFDKDTIQLVVAILLILLLAILYKLLSLALTSIKLISKMPVIKVLDKLLGIVVAVGEIVVILWAVYCVIMIVGGGTFGKWVMRCVENNPVMKFVYEYNYLYGRVERWGAKITQWDIWSKLGM